MVKKAISKTTSNKKDISTTKGNNFQFIKRWWFWVILVVLVIGGIASMGEDRDLSSSTLSDTGVKKQEEMSSTNSLGGHIVSENVATLYCEDASLIGKYLNLSDIDIVSLKVNYAHQYNIMDGWYDANKNSIVMIRWNGYDKISKQRIVFDCWISGEADDEIIVHWFSAAEDTGEKIDMIGSSNFVYYDSNGGERHY